MLRIVLRIMVIIIVLGHIMVLLKAPITGPEFSQFQAKDWILFVIIGIYFISIFAVWGYMFYHWGVSYFETKTLKRIWFWIILLGGFIYLGGPLVYYIIVVEKGKGLSTRQ